MHVVARVRVLFADTDAMGIVSHDAYLRYMELARVELLRATGPTLDSLRDLGFGLPVTDLAVAYRAPALYDDWLTLRARLVLLTRARCVFNYSFQVLAGGRRGLDRDVEIISGETRHALVTNGDPTRPRLLPKNLFRQFVEHWHQHRPGEIHGLQGK